MITTKITSEADDKTYPNEVIEGIRESVRQAELGQLFSYIGLRDMLDTNDEIYEVSKTS